MAEDFKLRAAISDQCQIYLKGGGTVCEEARKIWELYINRGYPSSRCAKYFILSLITNKLSQKLT